MAKNDITLQQLAERIEAGFAAQAQNIDERFALQSKETDKRFTLQSKETDERFAVQSKRMEEGFAAQTKMSQDIIQVMADMSNTIARSFTGLEKKVDAGFAQNQLEHEHMNARLSMMETDLSDLRQLHQEVRTIRSLLDKVVTRREFETVEKRLARVERHLGLK